MLCGSWRNWHGATLDRWCHLATFCFGLVEWTPLHTASELGVDGGIANCDSRGLDFQHQTLGAVVGSAGAARLQLSADHCLSVLSSN